MDDLKIIELYFQRNESAITETDVKYGRLCHSIAQNILADFQDSEECVNDSYLGVWNAIPPTRPKSLSAFLCGIVRNLALKKLRFNSAAKRTSSMEISLAELEETVPDNRYRPDISDEELGRLLSEFLMSQSPDVRNAFIRKYWYFDSIADIAKRYSFRESKVKSMLFHARERLKDFLEKEGVLI